MATIDWKNPTPLQSELVQAAVMAAFPRPADLRVFLFNRLGQDYDQIVAGGNYKNQVFDIVREAVANGWLETFVRRAREAKPGNPQLAALLPLIELTNAVTPDGRSVEDIVRGEGGFQDLLPWIGGLDATRRRICRIEHPINQAAGTGWLVADDLVLTNWHVVCEALPPGTSPATDFVCRFDYVKNALETSPGVTVKLAGAWCVASSPASAWEMGTGDAKPTAADLDFALLRLARPFGAELLPSGKPRGSIPVKRSTPPPPAQSIFLVLQHPEGEPLKLAIGTAEEVNASGSRITHKADTLPGSSGSPCFNAKLELVALHNTGDPKYKREAGPPQKNQAVPIGRIVDRLAALGVPKFWME